MKDALPIPNALPLQLAFLPISDERAPRFEVLAGRMTAGLSTLFELRLVVQCADAALKLGALLRRSVVVRMEDQPFLSEVQGIVAKAQALSIEPAGMSRYELVVVPPAWLLSKRINHRIFRGETVVEIAVRLLGEHGIGPDGLSARLLGDLRKRDYTVQYGETDLHLFERLLADEGLVFYFDFARQTQLVVVEDTTRQSLHLASRLPFRPASGMNATSPFVESCEPALETAFARAAIRDYDWQNPAYVIEGEEMVPMLTSDADLERYEFEIGEVASSDAAARRAGQTLGATFHPTRRLSVRTNVLVAPNTRLWIDGSPRPETEHELLVCGVTSSWSSEPASGKTVSTHDLVCAPAANTFKAPRLPKPRIAGVQTALVVGAEGKEIDVDEHGRVEVEFRWDRRDLHGLGASRRVRVSQGWAGVGYGLVALPRVNDEVVVAYLDGDPDEPVIVGRLHNPARPSPLQLPNDSTVTTWRSRSSPGGDGYNEILMDDRAGQERLEMHAQLDFKRVVERDAKEKVGRDLDVEVTGDHRATITGTSSHTAGVASDINAPDVSICGADHLSIHGTDTAFTAGTRTDYVASNFHVTAGSEYLKVDDVFQVTGEHFHVFAGSNIVLKAGSSTIVIDDGKIELNVGGSSIKMEAGTITIVSPLINLNP